MDRLTFWGTGDSQGVPRVYCECGVCGEARRTGRNRRLRSSVLLESGGEKLLIDCGPDFRLQMEREGLRSLKEILITHAHHDHIAGLPDYYDICRWLKLRGRIAAPEEVASLLRERYPWIWNNMDLIRLHGKFTWQGWTILPWKVNHGHNGYAFAYRFEKPGFRWAYCPDAIALTEDQKEPLRDLHLLILGTSFYKEAFPAQTRSVYDISEALELMAEIRPGRVFFTHLSHDIDMERRYPLPEGVTIADAGMKLKLGNFRQAKDCFSGSENLQ